MGWKRTLEHPRAELKYGVPPKGPSSLIPVSGERLLALLSQLLPLPHRSGRAAVRWGGHSKGPQRDWSCPRSAPSGAGLLQGSPPAHCLPAVVL